MDSLHRLPAPSTVRRLRYGLLALFLASLVLHSWRLGQFNSLVFDEVYYPRFAADYLQGKAFFDAHPPLGKYLIALGIALVNPLAQALGLPGNTDAGLWLSPMSYRWMTALAGSALPPLTAWLAFELGAGQPPRQRLTLGLLAGGLMLLDGLTLVESRFGLINIYWVVFGLLGQACWLATGAASGYRRHGWLLGAGLALGSAIAVKWNGAGFLLGMYLLWGLGRHPAIPVPLAIQRLTLPSLLLYGGLVPLVTYSLLWLPHLALAQVSFVEVHQMLWSAHHLIGEKPDAHPYCSPWYSWPLMLRPVAYFYQKVGNSPPSDIIPAPQAQTVYAVQGLGNPVLWMLATAAILVLAGYLISYWRRHPGSTDPTQTAPTAVFLLVNYGANWLPWMAVKRCLFLYHYMGALVFSVVAIAWLLTRWLTSPRLEFRRVAWGLLALIGLAFLFWLPVYLGLPLSPETLRWRWWLRSWI